MPRANTADLPVAVDLPEIELRFAELDDLTVSFERHKADSDPAGLFVGLPDDRCQCQHHGYVTAGRIVFRYADHDEIYQAGDAYVATPGHLPLMFGGTELVEFTRSSELAETMAVVERNLAASMAGQGA